TSPGAQTPTDARAMEPSESARENEAVVDAPVPPAQNGAPNSDRELGSDARAPADARPRPAVVTLPTSVAALAEPGADLRALEGAARTLDVETLEALGDRLVERTDELSQELDRLRTELASLRPAEIASQRGQAVLHSMERTSEQLDRLREKLDVVARALRARGKSAPPELERTVDEG
ncbi:MAG TPA: hypothetical protein VK116_05670, partial [Planctomycetota bacterium]|nr:hypothetical protein [Planctomycetota bacterium]